MYQVQHTGAFNSNHLSIFAEADDPSHVGVDHETCTDHLLLFTENAILSKLINSLLTMCASFIGKSAGLKTLMRFCGCEPGKARQVQFQTSFLLEIEAEQKKPHPRFVFGKIGMTRDLIRCSMNCCAKINLIFNTTLNLINKGSTRFRMKLSAFFR